ncbi:MAG: hypothetical protein GY893_04690, partial [bacterium]|nr:hypothetical protein [bacterium]
MTSVLGNNAPTISNVTDQSINEDENTGAINFTVADDETAVGALQVGTASSNATLVPPANVVIDGVDGNRTVTVKPADDQFGTATITLTVSDDNEPIAQAQTSFTVNVTAVNDPPTISNVTDQSINEDENTGAINFTVSDAETESGTLTVTKTSSNATLVPEANITIGSADGNRTVTVKPADDQFGTATITLTVSDGNLTASDSFTLTVAAVNDPPTITGIDAQTISEDSATGEINFIVSDTETAVGDLQVGTASSNATLVPPANVVIDGADGNRTVTVKPADDQFGTATITLTVSDDNEPI